MRKALALLWGVLLLSLLPSALTGCGCGFDCSGSNNNNGGNDNASLTLGFSSIRPEGLKEVFLEVDSITFKRSGANDVVFDDLTTSKLDLLEYPGDRQLVVLENERLEPGSYTEVLVNLPEVNDSYVQDSQDNRFPLNVENNRLVLDGLQLESGSRTFTIVFGLAQALQFDEDNSEYLLTESGIRIEDNEVDATLSGQVDRELFSDDSCGDKDESEEGNRIYLYEGGRTESTVVDIYLTDSTNTPEPGSVSPFAVASPVRNDSGDWEYAFGFLPPGEYTLAFSCNAIVDDPVEWDDLDIPQPDNEIYVLVLSEARDARCNLPPDSDSRCNRLD